MTATFSKNSTLALTDPDQSPTMAEHNAVGGQEIETSTEAAGRTEEDQSLTPSLYTRAWLEHTVAAGCGEKTLTQVFENLIMEDMQSRDLDTMTAVEESHEHSPAGPVIEKVLVVKHEDMPVEIDDQVLFAGAWIEGKLSGPNAGLGYETAKERSSGTERQC